MLYTALVIAANAATGWVTGAAAQDAALDALRTGDMKKLSLTAPAEVADAVLTDEAGAERRLSDWRGKYLLVSFWATWCAPCREEMPALDRLQTAMGGERFQVLTIATGRNAPAAIDRFFAEAGVTALPRLRDPKQEFARASGVIGLPATLLIDPEGREIGRMTGPADWAAPEALALIRAWTGAAE